MIKTLLWDLDNTLLDFPAAEHAAIRQAFAAFHLGPCPEDRIARYAALNDRYWKQLERGEITKAELLTQRFVEFFQTEGIAGPDPAAFNRTYQNYLGETVIFLDHSDALLRDLHGQVRQYLVTNGARRVQEKKLARSGLGAFLDGLFISEDIGAEKPSLDFFRPVLQALGDPPREELRLVGDSLTSDMAGGLRAGIPCCWYNPKGAPLPPDMAIRYDIRDLNEVRAIVANTP